MDSAWVELSVDSNVEELLTTLVRDAVWVQTHVPFDEIIPEVSTFEEFAEYMSPGLYLAGSNRNPSLVLPDPELDASKHWLMPLSNFQNLIQAAATAEENAVSVMTCLFNQPVTMDEDEMFVSRLIRHRLITLKQLMDKATVVFTDDSGGQDLFRVEPRPYGFHFEAEHHTSVRDIQVRTDEYLQWIREQPCGEGLPQDLYWAVNAGKQAWGNSRFWVRLPKDSLIRYESWTQIPWTPFTRSVEAINFLPTKKEQEQEEDSGTALFTSVDFIRYQYPQLEKPAHCVPWKAGDNGAYAIMHFVPVYDELTRERRDTGYEAAKARARKYGLAIFARDTGGNPSKAKDDDEFARLRICKHYYVCTWKEAELIFSGKIRQKFSAPLTDKGDPNPRFEALNRFQYEFLLPERMTAPYGDIDCKLDKNPHMDGRADEITWISIDFHIMMMAKLHNVELSHEDYLILSSDWRKTALDPEGNTRIKGKISRHFICKTVMFRTLLAQRLFMNYCWAHLEAIFAKVQKDPDSCTEEELRFSQLRIINEKGDEDSALDMGVYKDRCQLFRPGGCAKAPGKPGDAPRYLTLATINEYPVPENVTDLDLFRMSLLQRPPSGKFPDAMKTSWKAQDLGVEVVDFCMVNGVDIPLANYKISEDGRSIESFNIWNPGEGGVGKKRKANKKAAQEFQDLSRGKRRRTGDASFAFADSKAKKVFLEYVKKQVWATPWASEGRFDGDHVQVKFVKPSDGASPSIFVQPTMGKNGVPCEMETAMDGETEDGDWRRHRSSPVSIYLRLRWNPTTKRKQWLFQQLCTFNCQSRAASKGIDTAYLLSDEPAPKKLVKELGLE